MKITKIASIRDTVRIDTHFRFLKRNRTFVPISAVSRIEAVCGPIRADPGFGFRFVFFFRRAAGAREVRWILDLILILRLDST